MSVQYSNQPDAGVMRHTAWVVKTNRLPEHVSLPGSVAALLEGPRTAPYTFSMEQAAVEKARRLMEEENLRAMKREAAAAAREAAAKDASESAAAAAAAAAVAEEQEETKGGDMDADRTRSRSRSVEAEEARLRQHVAGVTPVHGSAEPLTPGSGSSATGAMVDIHANLRKIEIMKERTSAAEDVCSFLLEANDWDVEAAIKMHSTMS